MAIPKCLRFQKHKSVSMIFVEVNYTPVSIEFYNTCTFHLSQFVEFISCLENVEFLNKSISTFSTD
jgi:hypothetical protein